ncbi:TonB-dependent Receptor Plug Domain [Bryocella elongata]|uniref:TonB-dependent Receptor Plug Domain n=1 Tax=Bryocella elongata TaxID=863522 RepID=A0A1H6CGM2_9BACT|nr:TonB-dependent receptor [Bryocella elongata]SEG72160.1 TonB-dependent Receptor Plug Domain [Bryocella elongata]
MTRTLRHAALTAILLIAVLVLPPTAHGQGLGRISGTISDASGAAIPNATVTLERTGTGETLTATTDASGGYIFPSVAPAAYSVTATAAGFATYLQTSAILEADQALTVNATLKVGATTETVTVTDQPPQVDTTTGTLSQVIDEKRVNDLPLNGRNAATMTTLVPGVVVSPSTNIDQGSTKTFPVVAAVTINGTRANQVNYMLDGGNNVDEYTNVNAPFPFPDVLQEFSVETSNYNAEYGQNAGGVVNIITRGGSNKYHGDAFEYVRNRVFNAANYFTYTNGVKTRDFLKRNQFGGTFNGPVRIPHLYNGTDKTFFSFGTQATRYRNLASGGTATLPTPAQLAGTFTGLGSATAILNPTTLAPYPCTPTGTTYTCQVNPSDYNSASLALLKYLPTVSNANPTVNFLKPSSQNYIEYTARGDHELTGKDRLTLRYFYDRYDQKGVLDLTDLLTYTDQASIRYHNALISETHTFSPTLLNNIILSYQIDDSERGPLAGAPSVASLGVNVWQPAFSQINSIALTNFFTVGDNPAATFRRNNYTLSDDLHWVRGRHSFGFGFHLELAKVDVANDYEQPGQFTFNSNVTDASPVADFLLGGLTSLVQASGQYFTNRYHEQGYYAQDSWKISRRLTLNYGLRYEPFSPEHEALGREGMFSPSGWASGTISTSHPTALAGLLFPGDNGFVTDMVHPVYTHVMPRFGFAYDVFGNGRTSIRGGGGQFYDTRLPGVEDNIFANTVPFVASVSASFANTAGSRPAIFTNPYASVAGGNPFPAPQPPPANYFTTTNYQNASYTTFNPATFRVPVTYSFNLAVEQQITKTLSGRAAYVGSQARHQINPTDINPIWNQGSNIGHRIYYSATNQQQNYTSALATTDTGGNSNYNSLQVSLTDHIASSLTAFFNYTWSKALDNNPLGAQGVTAVVPGSSYVLPIYEPNYKRLDTGPADYDHRNVATFSYVWSLPALKSGNAALRYAVNGWQTNGIFAFRSGDALTVTGSNVDGTGLGRDRAVWNGQNPYGATACNGTTSACRSWYNPASFSVNPAYTANLALTYGNVVKGSFVGPQFASWDVSMIRAFHIYERSELQFRTEFFNVLNHTNFGDPQNAQTNSAFGRITSTNGDPRIGQLSLKLDF